MSKKKKKKNNLAPGQFSIIFSPTNKKKPPITQNKPTKAQLELLFKYINTEITNNCFVRLIDGKLGFVYSDTIFSVSFSSYSKKPSIISIPFNQFFSINLTSWRINELSQIKKYGIMSTTTSNEIEFRLSIIKKYLGSEIDYSAFFKFLSNNRDNELIAPYYKALFSAVKNNYDHIFNNVVNKTLNLFLHPKMLSGSKIKEISSPLQEATLNKNNSFTYLEYRETNGIYYTLSDESIVLSNEVVTKFNIKYLKKFAYVSGDVLSDLFSFLVVNINPNKKQIHYKYYADKWNEIIMPIQIEQYFASIDAVLSDISRVLLNIVSLVAQKTYNNEKSSYVSSNNSNNTYINHERNYNKHSKIIELPVSNSNKSTSDVLIINHKKINNKPSEKKMH